MGSLTVDRLTEMLWMMVDIFEDPSNGMNICKDPGHGSLKCRIAYRKVNASELPAYYRPYRVDIKKAEEKRKRNEAPTAAEDHQLFVRLLPFLRFWRTIGGVSCIGASNRMACGSGDDFEEVLLDPFLERNRGVLMWVYNVGLRKLDS